MRVGKVPIKIRRMPDNANDQPHATRGEPRRRQRRPSRRMLLDSTPMRLFLKPAALLLSTLLPSALLLSGAAWADSQQEAERLCLSAGRNAAIFEMLLVAATASGSPVTGVVACTWTFASADAPAGRIDLALRLETSLFANETVARFAMTAAMLPENSRGWTVEALPRLGDGGVMRTASKEGSLGDMMIEAVKGRRRFVLTARPGPDRAGNHRLPGQVVSFIGSGLHGL